MKFKSMIAAIATTIAMTTTAYATTVDSIDGWELKGYYINSAKSKVHVNAVFNEKKGTLKFKDTGITKQCFRVNVPWTCSTFLKDGRNNVFFNLDYVLDSVTVDSGGGLSNKRLEDHLTFSPPTK